MSKAISILLCIALCFCAAAAFAQEGMEGRTEGSGAFAYVDVADVDLLLLTAQYGKFVSPNLELSVGLLYADADGADIWGLSPQVAYHFVPEESATRVPYVGAGFMHIDLDGETESAWSLFGGMKFFLDGDYSDANQAIFAEVRWISDLADEDVLAIWGGFTQFFN